MKKLLLTLFLAVIGCCVSMAKTVDNGDGTYTYTLGVSKSELTNSNKTFDENDGNWTIATGTITRNGTTNYYAGGSKQTVNKVQIHTEKFKGKVITEIKVRGKQTASARFSWTASLDGTNASTEAKSYTTTEAETTTGAINLEVADKLYITWENPGTDVKGQWQLMSLTVTYKDKTQGGGENPDPVDPDPVNPDPVDPDPAEPVTVTINPASGEYANGTAVTMTAVPADALIYYTLDNSTPNTETSSVYNAYSGITITRNMTVKALAVKEGYANGTATATYTVAAPKKLAAPEFSVPSGTAVTRNSYVSISCTPTDAVIYYTTDGSTPTTTNGTLARHGVSVLIDKDMIIKAIAYKEGNTTSDVATASYTVKAADPNVTATPMFLPAPGIVPYDSYVMLYCETEGADIYFTTYRENETPENPDPSVNKNAGIYKGQGIHITHDMWISVIAIKDGRKSEIARGFYTVGTVAGLQTVATPTVSPASDSNVAPNTTVSIACSTPGASIYYKTKEYDSNYNVTNESGWKLYENGVTVTANTTINTFATKAGMLNSQEVVANYYIDESLKPKAATPAFSLPDGYVDAGTQVTMTCATPGATMYYSVNGGDILESAGPVTFTINEDTSIEAWAEADGFNDSETATAMYVLMQKVPAPVISPAGGEVFEGAEVTITCTDPNAYILYTTDGSEPTLDSDMYDGPITVNDDMTIKAWAWRGDDGWYDSDITTAVFTVLHSSITNAMFEFGNFDKTLAQCTSTSKPTATSDNTSSANNNLVGHTFREQVIDVTFNRTNDLYYPRWWMGTDKFDKGVRMYWGTTMRIATNCNDYRITKVEFGQTYGHTDFDKNFQNYITGVNFDDKIEGTWDAEAKTWTAPEYNPGARAANSEKAVVGVDVTPYDNTFFSELSVYYEPAPGVTAVEDIAADLVGNAAAKHYYNMQGMEVANPERGQIYIVRQGNRASKQLYR